MALFSVSASAQVHVLSPSEARFPHSSLVDFSRPEEAPAGKHGFLRVGGEGHFYFENGRRARFFGINIASRSVFLSEAAIDQVVDVIAQAGFNLVRLHHVDDVYGLIDGRQDHSRSLRAERLRTLDYWIARLKERGIYVYLDLLDYRTFRAGDGVENADKLGRGAKPYACFDPRLIELQKEYATKLLEEHVNPYTGLAYAQDPAVVLLEIFDENGLLIKHKLWRKLASPYRQRLTARWNAFLRRRHGNTAQLRKDWTNHQGQQALLPHESLERGTVELPDMELGELNDTSYARSVGSPVRKNEGALFAYEVQREFFRSMKAHLRGLGVRAPLSAVVSNHQMPDLRSVADELDFIGNNFYWDHPFWSAGRDWRLPSYFRGKNPVAEDTEVGFAPWATLSRVAGKPLVVREWGYCWPNRYRAAGMVEATAYACLQDIDALILFTYGAEPGKDRVGYFDIHSDPARWAVAGACATAFLRHDVSAARNTVSLCYSHTDTFYYFRYHNPLYRLAWVSKLQNRLYDDAWSTTGGLHIASGRSGSGVLLGTDRILFANGRSADLADSARVAVHPSIARLGVATGAPGKRSVSFAGTLFSPGASRTVQLWPPFALAAVKARGCEPIGTSAPAGAAYGLYDPTTRTYAFNSLATANVFRLGLDALNKLYGAPVSHASADASDYLSDTGEIRRRARLGLLTVDTPRLQACAGALSGRPVKLSQFSVAGVAGPGAALVVALSDDASEVGSEFLLKVATDAANEGQRVSQPRAGKRGVVAGFGRANVQTRGRVSRTPWRLSVRGAGEIRVYQSGGTCELVRQRDRWFVWTDAPGVEIRLPGLSANVKAFAHKPSGKHETVVVSHGILRYPVDTRTVEIPTVSPSH